MEYDKEDDEAYIDIKSYEFTVRKTTMTFDVITEDTQIPIMSGETMFKIEEGNELDYRQMVANDKVDGELDVVYEGDVNFAVAGEYKVVAKVQDNNGNMVAETITVTVTKPK